MDAQCGSSQQAAHLIAWLIANDVIDVGVACGVESMSRVSFGEASGGKSGRPDDWSVDTGDQFTSAERIADKRGLTRQELDELGLRSQQLAAQAWAEGRFDREILPIEAPMLGRGGQAHRRDPHGQPRRGPARDHPRRLGQAAHGASRGTPHRG